MSDFWGKILNSLLHEVENNPEKVIDLVDNIVTLLKDNPDAVKALVPVIITRMNIPPTVPKTN